MAKTQQFIVTALCRGDFADFLKLNEFEAITDEQMKDFAGRIQDAMMENGIFYDCVEKFAYEVKNNL